MKAICRFYILTLTSVLFFFSSAFAGTTWVSPETIAPDATWTDEDNAKDDDLDTYANSSFGGVGWSRPLMIIPPLNINKGGTDYLLCSGVRFNARRGGASNEIRKCKIEVNVFGDEGLIEREWASYPNHNWTEWNFKDTELDSMYYVELLYIYFYNTTSATRAAKLYEFDFGQGASFDQRLERSLDSALRRSRYDF